jgi:hypothetical protein
MSHSKQVVQLRHLRLVLGLVGDMPEKHPQGDAAARHRNGRGSESEVPRLSTAAFRQIGCAVSRHRQRRGRPAGRLAAVTGPTPWNRATGRDDELAVWLALAGRELGKKLVVGNAG